MKGKQTSNIAFEGYDHMDAFFLGEWSASDHYLYYNSPSFANEIAVCEDETRLDPTKEETKNQLNKLKWAWRKVYDESWLEDSHYYVILDNNYRFAWEQWYNTGWTIFFPYYKNMDCFNGPFNINTRVHNASTKNKLLVSMRENGYGSGQIGPFDSDYYDDFVDGKRYQYAPKNRCLNMAFTQNGISWYPFLLGREAPDGRIGTYNWCLIASKGMYLCVTYGDRGIYSSEETSFVYIPYTLGELGKVTIGQHKYFGRKMGQYFNKPNNSTVIRFTIKQYAFVVFREYQGGDTPSNRLRIVRFDPNGHVQTTYSRYYYTIHSERGGCPMAEINNKIYFMFTSQNTNSRDEVQVCNIATIDENGNLEIIYREKYIYVYVGGYYYAYQYGNKVQSVFSSSNILHDKKTGYYYAYADINSDSHAFPAEGNFHRVIVGKTRDFKSFSFFTPPQPYILIKGNTGNKNSLAICLNSQYEEQLKNQYVTTYLNMRCDIEANGSGQHRFCFHDEQLSEPNGIFSKVVRVDKGDRGNQIGMVFFIKNFDLSASNKDCLYSVYEYDEEGQVKYFDSQTLLNQLNGLPYPGKDT